ncbi:uncharacterized protein UHOD_11970 [Ustilago sp. UG-2017b]|nr:uncharacterized protein UHOD_11970 [Ustilago sp. UG-2017b]
MECFKKFELPENAKEAFHKLIQVFTTAGVLRHFDYHLPTRLETDASDFAIAGVLKQEHEGRWHLVAYYSRKMASAEKNYEIHDKELLAVVACLTQWCHMLAGLPSQLVILTDHEALKYFKSQHRITGRQARSTIHAKMEGLNSMHIWEVVDTPKNAHLVDSKLVLNIKTDANGMPYKFKARFCTCGFSQWEGLDYMEIFAPVVPHDTIWTVLVIAARHNWEIDSIDIKQVYLNTKLEHEIYLKPPEGANVDTVKQSIVNKWQIEDNGPAKEFLKIKITRDWRNRTIDLNQRVYIKDIIKEWIQPKEKAWTPMTMTPAKAPMDHVIGSNIKHWYPKLVGKLLWVSSTVRPDICYAVNTLTCHMSHPTEQAMQVVLHVIRYLNQTKDESTLGSIVKVYGSIVTWNSHVQKFVASSAVKAKYIASSSAAQEALFHRHLLQGLGFGDHTPTVFTDNTGCIQVARDPAMHSKLKHIDTKYHLLCDHVQEGDIAMEYIKTDNNVADFLTKPVSQHLLTHTRQHLGMTNVAPLICSVGEGES